MQKYSPALLYNIGNQSTPIGSPQTRLTELLLDSPYLFHYTGNQSMPARSPQKRFKRIEHSHNSLSITQALHRHRHTPKLTDSPNTTAFTTLAVLNRHSFLKNHISAQQSHTHCDRSNYIYFTAPEQVLFQLDVITTQ